MVAVVAAMTTTVFTMHRRSVNGLSYLKVDGSPIVWNELEHVPQVHCRNKLLPCFNVGIFSFPVI